MPEARLLAAPRHPDLWLVAAGATAVGALLMVVLVGFLHLGFWTATSAAGAGIAALLAARWFDAATGHDETARRRLSLRVAVAGIGGGIVIAAAYMAGRAQPPMTLAAAGVLLLATGYRAYRTEAYRQHVLEVADV